MSNLCKQPSLARCQPPTSIGLGLGRAVLHRAVAQDVRASSSDSSEVYLGFPKGDYAPRAGRKGRVIKDDPTKYPDKEDRGFFIGATGGWAGGEAALSNLLEEIKRESASETPTSTSVVRAAKAAKVQKGAAPIYLGFEKDEIELRKSGAPGRVIYDDPSKYPAKDNIGFMSGATGGFAGGERGLWSYVETGEVRLRKPGQPGGQPVSPLTIAFLVLLAGAVGAVVATQLYSTEDGSFHPEILQNIELDDNTKTALLSALALLGVVGGAAAVKSLAATVQSKILDSVGQTGELVKKVLVYSAFLGAVLLAARAVLEV